MLIYCLFMIVLLSSLFVVFSVFDDFVILSPHHRGARHFLKVVLHCVSPLGFKGRAGPGSKELS